MPNNNFMKIPVILWHLTECCQELWRVWDSTLFPSQSGSSATISWLLRRDMNWWVKNRGKFIIQSNSSGQRVIIFAPLLQASVLTRWYKKHQVTCEHTIGCRKEILSLGNLCFMPGSKHTYSLLWRGNTLSSNTTSKPTLCSRKRHFI